MDPDIKGHLPSSFPVPYLHLGMDHKQRRTGKGFVGDSTYTNAGDPSSMKNPGCYRNVQYKIPCQDLPSAKNLIKSKIPKNWKKQEKMNNSFYAFGSKSNIRDCFKKLNTYDEYLTEQGSNKDTKSTVSGITTASKAFSSVRLSSTLKPGSKNSIEP